MASQSDDDVFEKLKRKTDEKELAQQRAESEARVRSVQAKSGQRNAELIGSNSTLPVTISSIEVLQAQHTRRGFLERIFNPILHKNRDGSTLNDALVDMGSAYRTLQKFDIFQEPIAMYYDKPDKTDPSTSATDLAVYFYAKEKSRYTINTGTEAGHDEGSAFLNVILRNLFGGAESFNAHASIGTRTRSSYSANFETPILSNPDLKWEVGGLASSTIKSFASHEELLKGGSTKLKYLTPGGHRHEFGYSGYWRQLTGLAEGASPSVRQDAGDSFKSSIHHTWINERRDNPLMPSKGYLIKTVAEIAGLGALKGDVAFTKLEAETAAAIPLPAGISFTAGLRGGVLYPLTLAGQQSPSQSRLNDRFQLGGPTDVRGFRLGGLGPRDGTDSIGGDVYAAGGASLLFPIPKLGPESPIRLQAFINGGRLLGLQSPKSDEPLDSQAVSKCVKSTIAELQNGIPSCAAGLGLVYAHPVARFELNFSLPLYIRKGEEGRKGLQFGVGVSFL
ncbi:hypothetical protein EJ05DRAFT_497659 [Pseudovirgaria hyperparasitica]|uniref:Bacterial surface antigen (D15) domain-containing protein n=1 Tax=Pseudovirgaria hyperparasitica TaxID=470096 RepID=A0A6A6WFY1_9PEZI|nr:uncharacterized protein EJ05DRAFT_497659 [Pseudovirgaria hyperparasitica]KAF2761099.1 hypothetical protein EJ05DRAFT_497659 [Pseudovirgaria hyperparasitica]